MNWRVMVGAGLLVAAFSSAATRAQDTQDNAAVPARDETSSCTDCVTVPALTVVKVEIVDVLGSKISKTGDRFAIRLAEPVVVSGQEVIPAGAAGVGEVVHAKSSGGSGSAGELVLAARHIDIGGRQLRLRSLHVAQAGKSKINTVNAINVASAATVPLVSLVGFFVSGGQTTVAAGTVAEAKTAEVFVVAPAQPAATPAQQEKKEP